MLHYLRIAVTALSLTACVLLIALWVRSYQWRDFLFGRFDRPRAYQFESIHGQLTLSAFRDSGKPGWRIGKYPVSEWYASRGKVAPTRRPSLRVGCGDSVNYTGYHGLTLLLPHSLVVVLFGASGVAAWLPWSRRFSLRNLLIATTLVAAVLGVVTVIS